MVLARVPLSEGEETLKLTVTAPNGRTQEIDFTSLLEAHSAGFVAEQICDLLKKPAIPEEIAVLGRSRVVELLTLCGIECYESESLETLQEALRVNVDDGTISLSSPYP